MSKYHVGEMVTVVFDGWEHLGEIKEIRHGWYTCRIITDPEVDYPKAAMMGPRSIVCVPEANVHSRDSVADNC